jgi:short chain dehydrogenase
VVTGGTSGIGLAIARRFVAEGALVFITGRRRAQIDATAAEVGPQAVGVRCDVGNLAELDALYEVITRRSGRIDVLVANAGGAVPAVLGDITEEQFDSMFATNVKGAVFGVQKAMPLLSHGASVILIGSSTSERPSQGMEVYGDQGGATQLRPQLDAQRAGERFSGQRPESWGGPDPRPARHRPRGPAGPPGHDDGERAADRTARRLGRCRVGGSASGLGQLDARQRRRVVHRRRIHQRLKSTNWTFGVGKAGSHLAARARPSFVAWWPGASGSECR